MSAGTDEVKAIFLAAVEKSTEKERREYLDEVCAGNAELRGRVNELLDAFGEAGDFMENKPGAMLSPTVTHARTGEQPGSVIGPYKLLQQIGEGGFGEVYMAEQTEPVRRKVALKIIKPGMATKEVIARFEAERQALALMDHPNIARVLDAGTTDSGQPYFVMDLVKGVPLTEYCDKNHLSTRDRLNLFVDVCRATQHAHQKGVIHRDLKPSNIMVTLHDGKPVPKVIDFGVSKALSQQLTEKTLFTAYGQMVGTPAYMSPEQAEMSGLDIDTRSDIYSLGVLLYELLTGTTPFDGKRLRSAGYAEILRIIREEEPPKPSTRLTTLGEESAAISSNRGTDPKKLGQLVRGDLDWIVMKALEKDRNRRYETANGFAADIERFLNDKAIEARPPSVGYQMRKFARRNKAALVTAGMVVLVLIVGMVGTTWQAIRATDQRNRAVAAETRANEEAENARTEAAINQAVLDFLNEGLLGQTNPHNDPDRELKLRTVLDRAAKQIPGRFQDQPAVEAAIRLTLGDAFLGLGEFDPAREHLERALELNRQLYGDEDAKTLHVLTRYAWLEHDEGHYRRAGLLLHEVVQTARESLGSKHPITLFAQGRLADVYRHLGNLTEAENLFDKTITAMREVLGADDLQTLKCVNDLALVYVAQNRLDEAESLHRDVLETCQRVFGPESPRTLQSMSNMAIVYSKQGRYAEAERLHLQAFEIKLRVFGPDHPKTLVNMAGLANAAASRGREDEAESLRRDLLERRRRIIGSAHPYTFNTLNTLAGMYVRQQEYDKAEQLYRDQIQRLKDLSAEDPQVANHRHALARTYRRLGAVLGDINDRTTEAETYYQKAIDLIEQLVSEAPTDYQSRIELARHHAAFGWFRLETDRREEAKACFEQACRHYQAVPEEDLGISMGYLGQALYRAERYAEARVALEKVIALQGDEGPTREKGPRWWYLVMTLHRLGETEKAREYFNQLFDELKQDGAGPHWKTPHLDEAAEVLGIEIDWNR